MTTLRQLRKRLRDYHAHAAKVAKNSPRMEQRLLAKGRAKAYANALEWIELALGDLKARTA